jgi:glutaminyl-tRNA synthetase
MESPPKKFFRLGVGLMVRLKNAYIVKCEGFTKDENGIVTEIQCTYIPESRSGNDTSGIHVKGTIHWVSVEHAVAVEVRLYDRLFRVENPDGGEADFKDYINPDSLKIIERAYAEPSLQESTGKESYQFIRKGYFCLDKNSTSENLIFNRTVTLKDAWAKAQQ